VSSKVAVANSSCWLLACLTQLTIKAGNTC